MPNILAIDQGTTGTTCLIVNEGGRVVGRGYRELPQHFPAPGLVEHDPRDILRTVREAAREAVAEARAIPDAIGITNQRETVVLWDRATGEPVHRAIVWQDRRTAPHCAALAPQAERIGRLTGLVVDPYFSATKIAWLLAQGDLRRRAERGELAVGTVDAWLLWCLTNGRVHATEPTNASRTMLYDVARHAWSEELCELFDVPISLLPEVRPSIADFGTSDARLLGFAAPIRGIAGDQQAALFGQCGWTLGGAKNTYGTGAFLLLNCGAQRPTGGGGLLTTIAVGPGGAPAYALEAAIFVAGAAIQWLRDGLGLLGSAPESEALARSIRDTGGVYFVPALTGLGAPDWEPEARGTIVGLTRGTGRAHVVRAALEAMAYATSDVLGTMREHGGVALDRVRVDGGATSNDWLMQFQADVLGVPIDRPADVESTALGAAALAGIGAGIWPDADAYLASRRFRTFEPGDGQGAAAAGRAGWRRAVRAALAWARDAGGEG
jgi:glycerol kinase